LNSVTNTGCLLPIAGRRDWLPKKVISGGQTGADRAALDWALKNGIEHGGWCPKGRLAVDGPIASKYKLRETESAGYRQRTKLNVVGSDATLVLNTGELDGGTLQTVRFAQTLAKPSLVMQLDQISQEMAATMVTSWLRDRQVSSVNIAGPREEKRPGIYRMVLELLELCLLCDDCRVA